MIACYLHWPYETIMQMDHQERRAWVQEITRMVPRDGNVPEW